MGRYSVALTSVTFVLCVTAVPAVHEEMDERAREDQQVRQEAEYVCPVIYQQDEEGGRAQNDVHETDGRPEPSATS